MRRAFLQELRFACRLLRKRPRETAISVAIMALGIAGVVVAAALSPVLDSVLTDAGGVDRLSLETAAALLLVTALCACLVPAVGVWRLDPVAALKHA